MIESRKIHLKGLAILELIVLLVPLPNFLSVPRIVAGIIILIVFTRLAIIQRRDAKRMNIDQKTLKETNYFDNNVLRQNEKE